MSDAQRNLSLYLGDGVQCAGDPPRVLCPSPVPPLPVRVMQRLRVKAGGLDWERAWLRPLLEARTQALGAASASGPPRFLIRVDEFPYATGFYDEARYGYDASRRFHATMATAGVPHLMAIVPFPADDPLDPDGRGDRRLNERELALIDIMRGDGVTFAQHGTTHRTLNGDPRRRSELLGLAPAEAASVLDRGRECLRALGIETRVFVPPFNRFGHSQWSLLAERYDVLCGGPESIALMGFQGGPLWREGAVYLPCYAPLYGTAREILPVVERLIDLRPGTWVPIVLHTGWEADDGFAALGRLAERIAPYACPWPEFLDDVDRSRSPVLA